MKHLRDHFVVKSTVQSSTKTCIKTASQAVRNGHKSNGLRWIGFKVNQLRPFLMGGVCASKKSARSWRLERMQLGSAARSLRAHKVCY
ncbi:hypothetical protein KOW79_005630 [Hemibagrus wyckioides]|uniref:Uncharacterized protein n=1 Tax=Hemibagrus wyckioides TaxID=337641 RepID=A0A9D3NYW5_9TELE|nr:hypothetical protein KOW79_005630 [Hemibagrus wyckioides]